MSVAGNIPGNLPVQVYPFYVRRSREGQTAEKVREAMRDNV